MKAMIAFDTNVLVRLIVEDDPEQFQQANRLLIGCENKEEPCLVDMPILCEVIWVLKRCYRASRYDRALVVETLLADPAFRVADPESVLEALNRFRHGTADFADYLIGVRNHSLGASTTFTFDRALQGERDFTWIGADDQALEGTSRHEDD